MSNDHATFNSVGGDRSQNFSAADTAIAAASLVVSAVAAAPTAAAMLRPNADAKHRSEKPKK